MIQDAIARVVEGRDLSETEMMQVMEEITEGEASPAQIGAFLIGLRTKGESVDEIAAAARVVRSKTAPIPIGQSDVCLDRDEINVDRETVIDTCAFGEDCTRTFNVSTTTAFVVAAAGLRVAKFGYRYASSRWGSADVLEALGLPLDLTPRQVGECLDEVGIGFLYLPYLQGFMRHVAGIRREIGLRTIFNHLGPLSNPAGAKVQVVGVYREDHTELLAQVLKKLDCRRGLAVYGQDSFDELSITGPSRVTSLVDGAIETTVLSPEDLDLPRAEPEEIRGGNASQNAAITRTVLQGEMGARRNLVLLNAAAVLLAAGKVPAWKDGLGVAAEAIDSGRAQEKLERLVAMGSYMAQTTQTPTGWGWSSR